MNTSESAVSGIQQSLGVTIHWLWDPAPPQFKTKISDQVVNA